MAKKGDKRMMVVLACGDCGSRNYYSERNRVNTPAKLELKKYCRPCRKHTLHKESK
ncbi:MAG: 50S ribosomal protein L33 [bacterium]|jgi:large subunit ribosomal protein L33